MSDNYILDKDHNVVPCNDLLQWGKWFEDIRNRRVGWDRVNDLDISTVFLGLDHAFDGGPPLVFETMIFRHGESTDLYCARCSTWEEAIAQHAAAIAKVKAGEISDE